MHGDEFVLATDGADNWDDSLTDDDAMGDGYCGSCCWATRSFEAGPAYSRTRSHYWMAC